MLISCLTVFCIREFYLSFIIWWYSLWYWHYSDDEVILYNSWGILGSRAFTANLTLMPLKKGLTYMVSACKLQIILSKNLTEKLCKSCWSILELVLVLFTAVTHVSIRQLTQVMAPFRNSCLADWLGFPYLIVFRFFWPPTMKYLEKTSTDRKYNHYA